MKGGRLADQIREWIVSGICPECGRWTVTVGRCIKCGWESEKCKAEKGVDALLARARERRNASLDPHALAHNPAEHDWLTKAEQTEVHKLGLVIMKERDSLEEVVERLRRKKLARRAS